MRIVPESVSKPSVDACTAARAYAAIISLRLWYRSLSRPASGTKINIGIWLQKVTSPKRNPEPVVRYTSQESAIC